MKIKTSIGSKAFDVANYAFLIFLSIATFYPFYYVLASSLSQPLSLMQHEGLLLAPQGFSLESYKFVLRYPMILRGYLNTLIIVVAGVGFNLAATCLAAYGLSRKNLMFKRPIILMIIVTMYISGGLIPSFLLVNQFLHLGNTYWALWLPGLVSTYSMIILRTAMENIPDSLEESAHLDGANDFTILWRIILPLSKATIAVIVLQYGVAHWNSWFPAMIYLNDRKMFPLQLIMREILLADSTDIMTLDMSGDKAPIMGSIRYTTIIVGTVPILLVYPFLQKHFTKGVMLGSLKG